MKKINPTIICETIGTLAWLLMDFCWLSNYQYMAKFSAVLAYVFLMCAFLFYKAPKWSEFLSYVASFLWCSMNSCWMMSDFSGDKSLLVWAKWIFVITALLSVWIIYLSKKENEEINFTRYKVK